MKKVLFGVLIGVTSVVMILIGVFAYEMYLSVPYGLAMTERPVQSDTFIGLGEPVTYYVIGDTIYEVWR